MTVFYIFFPSRLLDLFYSRSDFPREFKESTKPTAIIISSNIRSGAIKASRKGYDSRTSSIY